MCISTQQSKKYQVTLHSRQTEQTTNILDCNFFQAEVSWTVVPLLRHSTFLYLCLLLYILCLLPKSRPVGQDLSLKQRLC